MKKILIILMIILSLSLMGCDTPTEIKSEDMYNHIGTRYWENLLIVRVVDRNPTQQLFNSRGEIIEYIDVNVLEDFSVITNPELYMYDESVFIDVIQRAIKLHLIIDEEYKQFLELYDTFIFRYHSKIIFEHFIIDGKVEYKVHHAITIFDKTLLAVENEKIVVDTNLSKNLIKFNKYKSFYPKLTSGLELSSFRYWLKTISIAKMTEENLDPEYKG